MAGLLFIAPPLPGQEPVSRDRAEELYRLGRHEWNRRTGPALHKAVALFEQALEKDPGFARAHAGLADAYNMLGDYRYLAPREAYPRARAAARRALNLDETLAEAHASLGWIRCIFDWDTAGAQAAFERAIALDPGYAITYHFLGFCLGSAGRHDEARAILEKAHRLDPASRIIATDLAVIAFFAGRWDEAIERLQALLDQDPDFATAHFSLGMAYQQSGRNREALAELRRAVELSGRSNLTLALLGHGCAVAGRSDEAREILAELRERAARGYVSGYDLAVLQAALGDTDGAFRSLEQAVAERAPWMLQLDGDPRLARLRSDPRFAALVERAGLPRWHPRPAPTNR